MHNGAESVKEKSEEKKTGGLGSGRDRYMSFRVKVKRRGESKQTIWLQRNSDEGFGAEKRFTVSVRCQISIGSPYTNDQQSSFIPVQSLPGLSICTRDGLACEV